MGSVAVSVLPSPVSISAMQPLKRAIPPNICTSKWSMRKVREPASRTKAKARGRSSAIFSPLLHDTAAKGSLCAIRRRSCLATIRHGAAISGNRRLQQGQTPSVGPPHIPRNTEGFRRRQPCLPDLTRSGGGGGGWQKHDSTVFPWTAHRKCPHLSSFSFAARQGNRAHGMEAHCCTLASKTALFRHFPQSLHSFLPTKPIQTNTLRALACFAFVVLDRRKRLPMHGGTVSMRGAKEQEKAMDDVSHVCTFTTQSIVGGWLASS